MCIYIYIYIIIYIMYITTYIYIYRERERERERERSSSDTAGELGHGSRYAIKISINNFNKRLRQMFQY